LNELSPRLSDLLEKSVEDYIKSAVPIASGHIAAKSEKSSATIRNGLKTLEEMGYLRQVHTSGGRVPTTMGYRAYIDLTTDATFAADLINDLAALSQLVSRIDRKLRGSVANPLVTMDREQTQERRNNIYKLLEVPDLEMSAFYLIIKERIDGRK